MATVVHHRFTVEEYERMIATGIVTENDRVELIQGEILQKMPVGKSHGAAVKRLNRLCAIRLADTATISIQDPIVLEDSEPEPDVVLLLPRDDFYAAAKPVARDVLLLIEVADASLEYDREVKSRLYARAAVPEYWIVNLRDWCVEVHRQPQSDGQYLESTTYARGQFIELLSFPGIQMTVDELLG